MRAHAATLAIALATAMLTVVIGAVSALTMWLWPSPGLPGLSSQATLAGGGGSAVVGAQALADVLLRPAPSVAADPAPPAEPTAPPPATAAGASGGSASARLRSEFRTSARLAVFIQDALNRPAEGGRFYALLAFQQCQTVRSADARAAEARGDARARVATLLRRCEGVADGVDDLADLYRQLDADQEGADALMPDGWGPVFGTALPERAEPEFAFARATGDPYRIAHALETHVDTLAQTRSELRSIRSADAYTHRLAAQAVACELTDECANWRAALMCAAEPGCVRPDARESLRRRLDPARQAGFEASRVAMRRMVRS